MATNVYEGMFILDSNRYGRNPESVVGQILKMIKEANGELLVNRLWEERRLAYQVKGHRKGTYWLTYFRADGKGVASLERKCQLSDTILRALFLKVDPRLVDAMIAHAQVGPVTGRPSPESGKPPVKVIAPVNDAIENGENGNDVDNGNDVVDAVEDPDDAEKD